MPLVKEIPELGDVIEIRHCDNNKATFYRGRLSKVGTVYGYLCYRNECGGWSKTRSYFHDIRKVPESELTEEERNYTAAEWWSDYDAIPYFREKVSAKFWGNPATIESE